MVCCNGDPQAKLNSEGASGGMAVVKSFSLCLHEDFLLFFVLKTIDITNNVLYVEARRNQKTRRNDDWKESIVLRSTIICNKILIET